MTKSHTIVMSFLLITIISVGVVRCKRATITDILQIWNNFWHTKGKNGMDTYMWMGSEILGHVTQPSMPGLKDILGTYGVQTGITLACLT